MININFNVPVRIISGRDCIRSHSNALKLGKKAMIVTGGTSAKMSGALDDVLSALADNSIEYILFDEVKPNPLLSVCERAGAIARNNKVDFIIGIGGGSPLDSCKVISVFASNDIKGETILEHKWTNSALPFVLIGTTAGTGSEITPYSVITMDSTGLKKSISSKDTLAKIAFCDPKYTDGLPLKHTLPTTIDAFCHACEGYFSTRGNLVSDMFSIEAIKMLLPVYRVLKDKAEIIELTKEMRDDLYFASILAGFSLNIASTCFGHALGYFLSENYHVPHGYACAVFLPSCLEKAEKHASEKSVQFYEAINSTREELTELLNSLLDYEMPVLSMDEIDDVMKRFDSYRPPNFDRTPGGYTNSDARTILEDLFAR